jgi:hypothetical protein
LTPDLQDMLHTDPLYSRPDLSTLTSRSSQLDALRDLRRAAVRNYTSLKNQERIIAKSVIRKLKHAPTTAVSVASLPGAPTFVSSTRGFAFDGAPATTPAFMSPAAHTSQQYHQAPPLMPPVEHQARSFMSPAEQTMQRYQPAPSTTGPNTFPTDPVTNFQSPYPAGFSGCMYCGSVDHVFRTCPKHESPGAAKTFFKNLFAHKPHLRKKPPSADEFLPANPYPSHGIPPTQSFPLTAPLPPSPAFFPRPPEHPTATTPAPPVTTPLSAPPAPAPLLKRARFCVTVAKSFSAHTSAPPRALPPMPIAIDNGLPHIEFNLGTDATLDPFLVGLMDTCGALNTGYLQFHLWLKSERPDLVAEFISFDDANPFEPIKLGGAISDPADFAVSDHGNLTAVIRYYTPYTDTTGSPITISFALGSDVTVNTIFGLPMLCDLDVVISLRSNSMHSRTLNLDFPITRSAVTFGLPTGCLFDPAASARNYASTCDLLPSAAASGLATQTPVPHSASASDDMSLGFLQRTVNPSL